MDPDFVDAICRNANNPDNIKSVNPYNPDNLEEVSRNQIAAIHRFLVAEVTPFASNLVADAQLKNMLNKQGNIIYVKRSKDTLPLYEKGKAMTFFMIIIDGKAELNFGHEAEMPIEVGPFRCFGIAALSDVKPTQNVIGSFMNPIATKGSQSIPNGVLSAADSSHNIALDRGGSCPPSAAVTPATTPVGSALNNLSEYTVTITSDEFIYAKVTRSEYRAMRNQMEIKKAQQVSSLEQIHKADRPTGFEPVSDAVDVVSEVTVSSDAVCQSESTIEDKDKKEESIPLLPVQKPERKDK